MKKPLPILPTILVGLAVVGMIALGLWQLRRAEWKDALLARYTSAATMPPVSYPAMTNNEALLFRRSSIMCLEPVAWTPAAGRNAKGESGWRHIAACRTGAEGPGVDVDMGWSSSFETRVAWGGGPVSGVIGPKPDHRSVVSQLFGAAPPAGVMLVAASPAPGLQPSMRPSPAEIPNNHRGYAVQWFIFAALALIIYALALRHRSRA